MNLRTGSRFLLARRHQRADDFQWFLRLLHHHYRGWRVALLLDEDPSHTAKGSVELAGWFDVELLWLPKRRPELNPVDTLWGQAKDVVCADEQYASLDEQVGRFIRHLEILPPQDALHTAGVLSEDFWLRDVL
jgi:transposase